MIRFNIKHMMFLVFWTALNAWQGHWLAVGVGVVTLVALSPAYRRVP